MVDTEKCFEQKLNDSEEDIRSCYWFDLEWRH